MDDPGLLRELHEIAALKTRDYDDYLAYCRNTGEPVMPPRYFHQLHNQEIAARERMVMQFLAYVAAHKARFSDSD